MASTLAITCPECDKQIKAPADLEGKKIRCKDCGHVFVVQAAAAGKPKAEAKTAPKKAPAPKKGAKPAKDDDRNPNPYTVVEESLTPRCPHCAAELESAESIVCLECGYNTHSRIRHPTVLTIEHTPVDWILWLLPGIVCVFVFFSMIGFIVFLLVWSTPIIEDAVKQEAWWAFAPRAMQLWGTIFALAIMFFTARFAIRRLIFNARPPEKLKAR
jgi:DNA-directed RNA polymerase subunit RPC12/RpoP